MRLRTYLGILAAVLVVVAVSYVVLLNIELLSSPFQLTEELAVPFYGLLLGVFLAAFLPTATLSLIQSVRRDLAVRSERRETRRRESVERADRRAVDLQADGQWRRAEEELQVVLADRPEDFSALLRCGEVLRHQGRHTEALEIHRRATVLYPQSIALLYQLAEDYQAQGQPEVAEEVRHRALRELPGLGLKLLRRQRDEALEQRRFLEAAELHERIQALIGGGASGEGERSITLGLTYQRGVALLEEERNGEAAELFRQLLADEPRFIPAAIMLGETELLSDRPDAAVAVWREGFERTGSPIFLQRIEDHFIEGEQPEKAIETLWSLIGQADQSPEANDLLPRFYLGRLYYRLEMLDEALKVLESVRERVGSSPTYHFLIARIHQRRGDHRRALEAGITCAHQLGVRDAEYQFRVCAASYPDWHDRCDRCGAWNSVELNFQEERLSPEELGVQPAPVWGGYAEAKQVRESA